MPTRRQCTKISRREAQRFYNALIRHSPFAIRHSLFAKEYTMDQISFPIGLWNTPPPELTRYQEMAAGGFTVVSIVVESPEQDGWRWIWHNKWAFVS